MQTPKRKKVIDIKMVWSQLLTFQLFDVQLWTFGSWCWAVAIQNAWTLSQRITESVFLLRWNLSEIGSFVVNIRQNFRQ